MAIIIKKEIISIKGLPSVTPKLSGIKSKKISINGIMTEKNRPGAKTQSLKPEIKKFKSGITAANRGLYDSHINYDGHTLYNGEIFNAAAKIKNVERNLPSKKIQKTPIRISIKTDTDRTRSGKSYDSDTPYDKSIPYYFQLVLKKATLNTSQKSKPKIKDTIVNKLPNIN